MARHSNFTWLPLSNRIGDGCAGVRERRFLAFETTSEEPLATYRGLCRRRHGEAGIGEPAIHGLHLPHADAHKVLVLRQSGSPATVERLWREAAAALRLPAMAGPAA